MYMYTWQSYCNCKGFPTHTSNISQWLLFLHFGYWPLLAAFSNVFENCNKPSELVELCKTLVGIIMST